MARPRKFDRDDLLEKALETFHERGYEATSVQDLGGRMGIHPGSLFNTFESKHSLFLEALTRYEERVRARLLEILARPIPRREAIAEIFDYTIRLLLDQRDSGQRGCFLTNSLMERAPLDPEIDSRAARHLLRLETLFYEALTQAIAAGEIGSRPEEDVRALARALMANLLSLRVLARVGASAETLHDVARVTLSLIGTPPPRPHSLSGG